MLMLIRETLILKVQRINFNTSHVNVNLFLHLRCLFLKDFNTSHVNVNPRTDSNYLRKRRISIHLMLMLIQYDNGEPFSTY